VDDDPSTNGILWIYGDPGTGKTILTAYIIEHLRHLKESLLLQFFCNDKSVDPDKTEVTAVIRSLLYQSWIRHRDTSLSTEYENAVRNSGHDHAISLDKMTELMVQVLKHPKSHPSYIIIDAVDECTETQALIGILRSFSITKTKILVSSRPRQFEYLRGPRDREIHIDQDRTDDDVRLFTKTTLNDALYNGIIRIKDKALKELVADSLIDKAKGM